MRRKIQWLLLVVLALGGLLTACNLQGTPPPGKPTIIPETTNVADGTTRAALTDYDPDTGVMRFASMTGVLAKVEPDDVLVSEPSSVAPYGYLRKVKAVRRDGDAVILETTQANLTDAIHQGTLDAAFDLKPEDMVEPQTFVNGLSITPSADVHPEFPFHANFDETVLESNDGGVSSKVTVSGSVYFKLDVHVGLDIEGCWEIPPFCITRFEASTGVSQYADLRIAGEASAKLTKDVKVADIPFDTFCFMIGPVPVCIVPTFYIFVGVSGEVKMSFDYRVVETFGARIGAKWTEDHGWKNISQDPTFDTKMDQNPTISAQLKASAYTRGEFALMLYGVSGPTIGAKLGVELDAAIPRDPFWVLSGFVEAYYGFIVDLPVVGRLADARGTIFHLSKEFGRSANSPPRIIIRVPNTRVELGQPAELRFMFNDGACAGIYCVSDPEDGQLSYTLTSNVDGPLTPSLYTFPTPGVRTITVRATDSKGASSSASFQIDVVNTPPVAYGGVGSATVPKTVPYFISAAASDPNSKLDCSALRWSATSPDVVEAVVIGTNVCYGRAVFNVQGSRSVTLTAVDPQGAVSKPHTFNVYVTAPPPNQPPLIDQPLTVSDSFGPIPFGGFARSNNITLSVHATDPEHPDDPNAISYAFSASCAQCVYSLVVPLEGGSSGSLTLFNALSWYPYPTPDGDIEVSFYVTVSDYTTATTLVWMVRKYENSIH